MRDRIEDLRGTDALLRHVRWAGAAFATLQFLLYQPEETLEVPFSQLRMGLLTAGLVVAVNVVSLWARRIDDPHVLAWIGVGQLVADTAIVAGVVWLFSFDPQSSLWALFVIPALEGAVRFQFRGAVWTWAASAALYTIRALWAANAYPEVSFQIDSVTYRMGIVAIVGLASGALAQSLRVQMLAHRGSRRESDRRAELLKIVAASGREMATLDADRVLSHSVEALRSIGFDHAAACVMRDDGTYTVDHISGVNDVALTSGSTDIGVVGRVHREGRTVVEPEYGAWPGAVPAVRDAGFRSIAGTPIYRGDELTAVLLAGFLEPGSPPGHAIECLELLAAQAGAALRNATLYRERRIFEEQLTHQAFHDDLTELPNRVLFIDRLRHALALRERASGGLAVLFCNLDGFQKVNDSFDHEVGDEILRAVAQRLRGCVRPGDTVARFGGDEFTVLLEGLTDQQQALAVVRRILERLAEPFEARGRHVFLSTSIGIAHTTTDADASRDFLHEADVAMYRAKLAGGGRYEVFRPKMAADARRRLELEEELRHAVRDEEFLLHYQPIVATDSLRLFALEALVRWQPRGRELVPPDEFLPMAEETGLIMPIGSWVLEEACRQLVAWSRPSRLHRPEAICVNLSATEFRQPGFADRLEKLLDRTGIQPSSLVLEVTESVVMRQGEEMEQLLSRIGATGVRIAIDDFGRGYSSLSYLKRFPVDILKIDRSFVDGLMRHTEDRAIVRSVLLLAQDLGIQVIAEGVETPEQLEHLDRIGCDYVQGYQLGRPQPAEKAAVASSSVGLVS